MRIPSSVLSAVSLASFVPSVIAASVLAISVIAIPTERTTATPRTTSVGVTTDSIVTDREPVDVVVVDTPRLVETRANADPRTSRFDQLIGRRPAELGTLFDHIHLAASFKGRRTHGPGWFEPKDVRRRVAAATHDGFFIVDLDVNTDEVVVQTLGGGGPETCRTLRAKLEAAWGPGVVWLDP